MRLKYSSRGAALVAVLLIAASASATVIVQLDLTDLVQRAGAVFVGKAVKTQMHWTADRKHIVTDTTFQVGTPLRGTRLGGQVTVRSLGGVVDGIGMRVSGSPSFKKGDEVLLFTEKRGAHRYVVGMTQGAYRVSRDAKNRATVRVNLSGVSLARRTQKGLRLLHGHQVGGARQHELSTFISRIKKTMKAQRLKRPGATPTGAR